MGPKIKRYAGFRVNGSKKTAKRDLAKANRRAAKSLIRTGEVAHRPTRG
jgi:hypothetical protein